MNLSSQQQFSNRQVCRHMLLAKRSTLLCLLFSFPSAGFGLHNPINHHWVAACLVQNLLPCGLDFLNSRFVSTALDYTVTACKPVWNETVIRKRCSFDSILLQQVAKSRHLNVQQMTECVLGQIPYELEIIILSFPNNISICLGGELLWFVGS